MIKVRIVAPDVMRAYVGPDVQAGDVVELENGHLAAIALQEGWVSEAGHSPASKGRRKAADTTEGRRGPAAPKAPRPTKPSR